MSEETITPKKLKILTISDNPISKSGVANVTRDIIEAMIKTGRYQFISLGGAIKHTSYKLIKTEEYGDDWIIYPVDGFGNADIVRSVMRTTRPDILWHMSDPRFYEWLWMIENEIRPIIPMMYNMIWDNGPAPKFNKKYYESEDLLVSISGVTYDISKEVAPNVENIRLPHCVDTNVFKRYPDEKINDFVKKTIGKKDKFIFLWNNRNARRKNSGSLVWWFRDFLDIVGQDKAMLIMHTDPHDEHGVDLHEIIKERNLNHGEVLFSTQSVSREHIAMMYNISDCVINIANAEGWGLSQTEAMACEVPTIATLTGGLQEQITDGNEWYGAGIVPTSKMIIGSQVMVPYIYEDNISKESFLEAMLKIYNMSLEERQEMGKKARARVLRDYNFDNYMKKWDEIFQYVHEKYGSWSSRRGYKSWNMVKI